MPSPQRLSPFYLSVCVKLLEHHHCTEIAGSMLAGKGSAARLHPTKIFNKECNKSLSISVMPLCNYPFITSYCSFKEERTCEEGIAGRKACLRSGRAAALEEVVGHALATLRLIFPALIRR